MNKNLFFISFFCAFQFLNGQKSIYQFNKMVKNLPTAEKIELRNLRGIETNKTPKYLKTDEFTFPLNSSTPTIIKYNDKLQSLKDITKKTYYKNLFPKLNVKDVRFIPEYYLDFSSNSQANSNPLIYTPIIVSSKPLIIDKEKGYKAKVSLVLLSEDTKQKKVTTPIKLEIVSKELKVKPSKISLSHLNLPTTDIDLYTESIKDSAAIRILTNSNLKNGYTYYLKVKPSLLLETNRKKIQGFGIQKTNLTVRFKGSSSRKQEKINIISSLGEVTPSSFSLAYNEAKNITVRSEGIEDIKLIASISSAKEPMKSNILVIEQVFPYLFLIFSLVGGIIGMLIRFGLKKDKKKYTSKLFLSGILIGLLGTIIYYVLGVNFLKIEVSDTFNEFAVMGFSALCSLFLKPSMFKVL